MSTRVSRSGIRRQVVRSNGWIEDSDVSPVISKTRPLDNDIVAMAIVKRRLVSALSREQAVQRLSELLVPMLSVRAVLRRRMGRETKDDRTLGNGGPTTANSRVVSSRSDPTPFTTKQMVSAIRRCDGTFNCNWSASMLTALVHGATIKHYRVDEHVVLAKEPHLSSGLVLLLHGAVVQVAFGDAQQPPRARKAPAQLCEESVLSESVSTCAVRVSSATATVAVIRSSAVWSTALKQLQVEKAGSSSSSTPDWWQEFVSVAAAARLRVLPLPTVSSVLQVSALAGHIKDMHKVSELCSLFEVATYAPDEPISFPTEGTNAELPRMVAVVRGSAVATVRTTEALVSGCHDPPVVATLHAGSVVGEMQLLFGCNASSPLVDLRAGASFCDVWTLGSAALHRFCATSLTSDERDVLLKAALHNREVWLTSMAAHSAEQQHHGMGGSDPRRRSISTLNNIAGLLRQVPTLCHCTDSVLCELAVCMQGIVVPAKALVVEAGTPVDRLVLLLRGVVTRADACLSTQDPVDTQSDMYVRQSPSYLGECCLLPHCWTDSWVASSDVDALTIAAVTIRDVLQRGHLEAQALDVTQQGLMLYRRRQRSEGRRSQAGDEEPTAYAVEPPAMVAPTSRGRRPSSLATAVSATNVASTHHLEACQALWGSWSNRVQHAPPTATGPYPHPSSRTPSRSMRLLPLSTNGQIAAARSPQWLTGSYDVVVAQTGTTQFQPIRRGTANGDAGPLSPLPMEQPGQTMRRDDSDVRSSGAPSTVNSFVQTRLVAPPPMIEVLADISASGRSACEAGEPLAIRPTAREDCAHDGGTPLTIDVVSGTWQPADHTSGTPLVLERTFRPAPPTIERPHTTGTHSGSNGVMGGGSTGGGFVRQTVVPATSAHALQHPHSSLRPITTGSMASTTSPSQVTTPQRSVDMQHGRAPVPLLSPEALALDTSGLEASQSNRRTDPLTKERTVLSSAQRAVRPFSAQSRGQPSPLSRMVQLSTTSPELSSVQPDSIWGTFLGLDDTGNATPSFDTISPTDGATHRPPLSFKGRSKPIVLLVHVIGCKDLEGCDSLIEPVVKVLGCGGRVYMTTPAMRNTTNPVWSIEEASFITVLLRRDELTVVVCDNDTDACHIVYTATMPTAHMESNSGAGLVTVKLLNANRQPTRSSVTLRFLATSPAQGGGADLHGAVTGGAATNQCLDISGGTSRHLFAAHDMSRGGGAMAGCSVLVIALADATIRAPTNAHTQHKRHSSKQRPSDPIGNVVAEVVMDGVVVLKATAAAAYDDLTQSFAIAWGPQAASCALECEGGLLEIRIRPASGGGSESGGWIGHATFSLDDLVFTGPGMRGTNLTSDADDAPLGTLRLHVLHADTLSDPSAASTSSIPLALVAVHGYENQHPSSSAHMTLPWLPDPFVTIRRHPSEGTGAGDARQATLLARSSLVFGETHPHWALHDASCVIAPPRTTHAFSLGEDSTTAAIVDVALWDNSEANLVGQASLAISQTTHGRMLVDLDNGGTITVDVTPLALARIGPATKQLQSGSPTATRLTSEAQQHPPVLVVFVSGCTGLCRNRSSLGAFDMDETVDPLVTARFSGERGRQRLMRSNVRYGAANPTWGPTEGAVFAVDLSSCALSSAANANTMRDDDIVFEVWDANEIEADLLGAVRVGLRSLVRVGRGVQRFELCDKTAAGGAVRSPHHSAIVVESVLTYPNTAPVGLMPSGTDLLMAALALVDEDDGSLIEPNSPTLVAESASQADDDVHRSARRLPRNESFLRRTMPVRMHVCGCSNLPSTDGHPFIVTQRNGTVLSSTPVAVRGDMRHPSWSPAEATTTLMLPVHRGRFEDTNEPLHFVVMWQHGSTVAEIGRATVNMATLLNGGGYLTPGKESEACGSDVFLIKTMDLRCVPVVGVRQDAKPTLTIVVSHKPK